MIFPSLALDLFRFRNDDGSETPATWQAATNVSVYLSVDTTFRLRAAIRETNGADASGAFNLEYSLNGGAYATVTTSTPVKVVTSANVSDGTATTQQISSGTFVAGEVDTNGSVASKTLNGSSTEHEWVLQLDSAQVATSDTVRFQVANVNVYSVTPTITVGTPDASEYARVQYATAASADPYSVTLPEAPSEGQLIVVTLSTRSGGAADTVTISGFTKIFERLYDFNDTTYRKGIAQFYKIAGASESATITSSNWSAGTTGSIVAEVFPALGWTYLGNASNDTGTTANVTSIATGTTASLAAVPKLLIATVAVKEDGTTGLSIVQLSATNDFSYPISVPSSSLPLGSLYVGDSTAGTKTSTISWSAPTTNLGAIACITAFEYESGTVDVDINLTRNEKTLNFIELTLDATSNVDVNLTRNEKTTSYQEFALDLTTLFETDLVLVTLNTSYQEFIFDKTDNIDVNLTRNEKTLNFIELALDSDGLFDLIRNEKTLNFIELTFDSQSLLDLVRNEKTLNFIELTLDVTSNIDINLTRNEKTISYQEFTLDAVVIFEADLTRNEKTLNFIDLTLDVASNVDTNLARNEKTISYQDLVFDKIDNIDANLTRSEKNTNYQELVLDAVRNFGTDLLLTTSNVQYQELEFVVIANLDTNLVRNEKIVRYQTLAIRIAIYNLTTTDIDSTTARFNWEYDGSFV